MSDRLSPGPQWIDNRHHHAWLASETDRLLDFYRFTASDDERGGFWWLGDDRRPLRHHGKELWINARMVHAFAIGSLLGRPGCARLVEHGLRYLEHGPLRDAQHGGWMWAVDERDTLTDPTKQNYGHAFVLLAACTAAQAGYDARSVLQDVIGIIDEHFWQAADGLCVDTYDRTWSNCQAYRGQNSNMHMTEAFMAAAEVTGERRFLERAVRIAERLIGRLTAANDWRLAEHYDQYWNIDRDYNKDQPNTLFRPYGSTVGHWFEWAKLLLQLRSMGGDRTGWMADAARTLFDRGVAEAWDTENTGFVYSVDWDGSALNRDRYHWVIAEAIGAAVYLYRLSGSAHYARWYRAFWDHVDAHVIDHRHGSWFHQLDPANAPLSDPWEGKPDLYHALQATLYARAPADMGLGLALARGRVR
jgi:mannose/cellobiose epimerase-like protein (N-acyl-D-glucosamine 2-epimerase family)